MAEHPDPTVTGSSTLPTCGDTPSGGGDTPRAPLSSVLLVGQRSLGQQRRGRFVAGSGAHPARMAPDLAAALIHDYTQPGDLVFDPLVGIGTTLVEAIHAGRNALGVEYEAGWVALARANIDLARRQGGTGHGRVLRGDATGLPHGVPTELHGQIGLILTSPPYGKTMHGRVEHRRGPLTRFHNTYSHTPGHNQDHPGNLAHRGHAHLLDGITAVLAGCIPLLKPDGVIVVVARPWRRDHFLVDLPGQIIQAALAAGLQLIACRRAVHAAVRDGRLVPHHSFWQLSVARASRRKGLPISLIQHDDIAVLQPIGPPLRTEPIQRADTSTSPPVSDPEEPGTTIHSPAATTTRPASTPLRESHYPRRPPITGQAGSYTRPAATRPFESATALRCRPTREAERTPDPCPHGRRPVSGPVPPHPIDHQPPNDHDAPHPPAGQPDPAGRQ